MASRFELLWHGSDGVERSFAVDDLVSVGRGVNNDLVIPSDRVSWQHARFWPEGGVLWVADAGSTNGTYVNDRKLEANTRLVPGDRVRLGQSLSFVVRMGEGPLRSSVGALVVEDANSGVRYPLADRFVLGPDADAHLRIADVPRTEITRSGEFGHDIHVRGPAGEQSLKFGEVFEAAGLSLRVLLLGRQAPVPTVRPGWEADEYHIDATLIGRTPAARVYDDRGASLSVEGETRATLIYVLAQQVVRDRESGALPSDVGWIDDGEAVQRVWGRTSAGDVSNRLSVVVYRLRSDLKKSGLEPSFVERERGRIRLRAAQISLS
jgi:hypothetical protein